MSNKTRRIDLIRSPNASFQPNGDDWQPFRSEGSDRVEGWRAPTSGFMRLRFEGSEIYLTGHYKLPAGKDNGIPSINCYVDEQHIPPIYRSVEGKDWSCSWNGTDATASQGAHNFSINAAFPIGFGEDPESEATIDSFHYLPSASTQEFLTQGASVVYDNSDPHIDYTGTWDSLRDDDGEAVSVTARQGSSMSVIFTGNSVTWYGWLPAGQVPGRSSATYWVDSGDPVVINWEKPRLESTLRGMRLFSVTDLAQGAHNLTVAYQGSDSALPLVLDYLLVGGGEYRIEAERPTLPPQGSRSDTVPSTTPSPASSTSQPSRAGAIVGGVIGALAATVLAALVLLWLKRRKSRTDDADGPLPTSTSFTHPTTVPPFSSSAIHRKENGPVSGSQTEQSSFTNHTSIQAVSINPPTSDTSSNYPATAPTTYRKADEATLSPRSEESSAGSTIPRQHQDSGVRLTPNRRSSLPPVYSAE
ncbi:hypothetical protein BKA70DRAFT_1435138 [Coprinopsis sp. MPI-PUGE-AT-0042]|nr:hypothetical protein BKA70DRAFT_1435138 [Coprinopsis sp. MPI-PUGE-AT-0042]